jgi:hypothetical protein
MAVATAVLVDSDVSVEVGTTVRVAVGVSGRWHRSVGLAVGVLVEVTADCSVIAYGRSSQSDAESRSVEIARLLATSTAERNFVVRVPSPTSPSPRMRCT